MAKQKQDFLGTGWSSPPRFSRGGALLEMTSGPANVHKSIRIIMETDWGERVMRDDFGGGLRHYLFETVNERLINFLKKTITKAILHHEPRVKLEAITITEDQSTAGRLFIRLQYTVKSTNSRFNMVYPFDINNP